MPINAEADAYIRDLIGKEVCMTCEYEGDPFKNGVDLTTATGENINDTIKRLLIPDWKRENHDGNYLSHKCNTSNRASLSF